MELFICPICKKELIRQDRIAVCKNGHSFDYAKKGYLNLLVSNKKKSANPGDNKNMVLARKKVMEAGYYNKLLDTLGTILKSISPKVLLDLGCGDGSLTQKISAYSETTIGLDVSKDAINTAASDKNTFYIVASGADIPLKQNSVDVVLNCFAPIYPKSVKNVLKSDGVLIKVTPFENHLFELKQELYPSPYLNPPDKDIEGFELIEKTTVEDVVELNGEYLLNVLTMTPYYYKTPKDLLEKVLDKNIKTTLSFSVRVLKGR